MVIVFALAGLAHVPVVSVARRRREVGTRKALGFVRCQAAAVTPWASVTVVVVGLVAGIPLGVAARRGAWTLFAHRFGLVDDRVALQAGGLGGPGHPGGGGAGRRRAGRPRRPDPPRRSAPGGARRALVLLGPHKHLFASWR